MYGVQVNHVVHLNGTLAANAVGFVPTWKKQGATLLEVSAVASNDSDATLKIGVGGTSPDDDGIMTAKVIGDSGAPVWFTVADFNGALADTLKKTCPRLGPESTFTWTLDYDGASGTAAANVTITFTLLIGGAVSGVSGLTP
jgi:hypothetical protein